MRLEFMTVDVFTETRFGGNPLAVLPDAAALNSVVPASVGIPEDERVARLEEQLADLQREVSDLKQVFEGFRKQFE